MVHLKIILSSKVNEEVVCYGTLIVMCTVLFSSTRDLGPTSYHRRKLPLKTICKTWLLKGKPQGTAAGSLKQKCGNTEPLLWWLLRACRTCVYSFIDLTKSLILLSAKREDFQVHWTTGEWCFN